MDESFKPENSLADDIIQALFPEGEKKTNLLCITFEGEDPIKGDPEFPVSMLTREKRENQPDIIRYYVGFTSYLRKRDYQKLSVMLKKLYPSCQVFKETLKRESMSIIKRVVV